MIEPLQIPVTPSGSLLQPKPRRARPRAGFSLVELSLALLVVSIGLISLIGLFPASLDMSQNAIDETYASFLADSAFTSYREAAMHIPWEDLDKYEPIAPNTIEDKQANTVNNDVFWKKSEDLRLIPSSSLNDQARVLVFTAGSSEFKWGQSNPNILGSNWEMEDHALRYRLFVEPDTDPRIKRIYLEVWRGQFGDINNQEPERFYTEIFQHKAVN